MGPLAFGESPHDEGLIEAVTTARLSEADARAAYAQRAVAVMDVSGASAVVSLWQALGCGTASPRRSSSRFHAHDDFVAMLARE